MIPAGFEPATSPWKGNDFNHLSMGPYYFLTLYKYYTINFLFFQIIFLIWCAVSENIHRNHTHLFRVAQTILEYLTELPPLYEVSLLGVPK